MMKRIWKYISPLVGLALFFGAASGLVWANVNLPMGHHEIKVDVLVLEPLEWRGPTTATVQVYRGQTVQVTHPDSADPWGVRNLGPETIVVNLTATVDSVGPTHRILTAFVNPASIELPGSMAEDAYISFGVYVKAATQTMPGEYVVRIRGAQVEQ